MLDKPVFRRAWQYVRLLAVQPAQHPVGRPRWRDRHCHRRCRHRTVDLVKAQIIAGAHEMGDATLLGHMYVFWRIWQILPLGGWYKAALISCLLMGLISLVVIFTAGLDRWPLPLARIIYEAGTSWLFILLYLFMLFALLDLGRLTHLVKPSFLQSSAAGSLTVALLISAIFLYGNINYQHKVRRHITIDSEGKVKKPVKVVLLSDLHLGYHNTREDLQKWVRIVNNEQADAVLIAGDIIDISLRPLLEEDMAEVFRQIKAPVYACLGNHEYYAGTAGGQDFFK